MPEYSDSTQTENLDDGESVPTLGRRLDGARNYVTITVKLFGAWLLFPLAGLIVLIAAASQEGGLHAGTGVLAFVLGIAFAFTPRLPRSKDIRLPWLLFPVAGAVIFLVFVDNDLNDPLGGQQWWLGLVIFAATIWIALAPQIHSFRWIDLGSNTSDERNRTMSNDSDPYDLRMRAIARFVSRTIILTAVILVLGGAVSGFAGGEELGIGDGGRVTGAVIGLVVGGFLAQFWLGFATLVWFTADIAQHTRTRSLATKTQRDIPGTTAEGSSNETPQ